MSHELPTPETSPESKLARCPESQVGLGEPGELTGITFKPSQYVASRSFSKQKHHVIAGHVKLIIQITTANQQHTAAKCAVT